MSTYIKTMKDINGDTVLPKTNIKAIYDDSGNRLDGILNGSLLPSFTPNLSVSDTIPMHQNGSNVKIRLDDFLVQAGAPYGGIVGSGSNANGSYISFADGSMICKGRGTGTLTFPNQFLAGTAPEVSISTLANGLGVIIVASVVDITNSNFKTSPKYWDGYTFQLAGEIVSYTAIGRWK